MNANCCHLDQKQSSDCSTFHEHQPEVGGRQKYSSSHEVPRSVRPQPSAGNQPAPQSALLLPDRLLMLKPTHGSEQGRL